MSSGYYLLVAMVMVLSIVSIVMWTTGDIKGTKGDAGAKGEKGDVGTACTNDNVLIGDMMKDLAQLKRIIIVTPILSLRTDLITQIPITSNSEIDINDYVNINDIEVNLNAELYTTGITITRQLQEFKILYTATTVYGPTTILERTITMVDTTVLVISIHPYDYIHIIGSIFQVSTANVDVNESYQVDYKINNGTWIDGNLITNLEPRSTIVYNIIFRATYAVNKRSTEVLQTIEFVRL